MGMSEQAAARALGCCHDEGCFDRSEASHAVSLCDMHAKYADVVSTAEILSYFNELPADLFDLPTGSCGPAPPIKLAAE
jgi:maleamate amidohydrolase